MNYKKRNYLICAIIFTSFAILILSFIFFGPMSDTDSYITFGAGRMEWFFASSMMSVAILGSGILSLYLGVPLFSKMLVKSLGKKQQVGVVPEIELSGAKHLLRLWGRSLVLGFFIANISYTLSANENFILFMLTDVGEAEMRSQYGGALLIPDPLLMMQLIWMLAIPLTFIVVPIWTMIDVGLASAKKVTGVDFSSVNLTTSRLYKIIKGYAGIGFIYNFTILILDWSIFKSTAEEFEFGTVIQLVVPFVLISNVFPLAIFIDYQKKNYKKKFEAIITKLDMNKELKCTVELIGRR